MIVRELLTKLGFQTGNIGAVAQAQTAVNGFKAAATQATVAADIGSTAIGGYIKGFLGIAAAFMAARSFWRVNAEFSMISDTLTTVTGSVEEANAVMESLRRTYQQTPFTLQQTSEAYIALRTVGVNATEDLLLAMGNLAATKTGATIMDVANATRSAILGNARGLREFGVRAEAAGNQIRLTFRGETTEIANTADAITGYLQTLSETNFASGMANSMDDFNDFWGLLKNRIYDFWISVGESGVVGALNDIGRAILDLFGGVDDLGTSIGHLVAAPLRILASTLQFIARHTTALKVLLVGIASRAIFAGIMSIVSALSAMAATMTMGSLAASALRFAMMSALLLIPLLIEDFLVFLEGGKSVMGEMADQWIGEGGLKGAIAEFLVYLRDHSSEILGWAEATSKNIGLFFDDVSTSVGDLIFMLDQLMTGVLGGSLDQSLANINERMGGEGGLRSNLGAIAEAIVAIGEAAKTAQEYADWIFGNSALQLFADDPSLATDNPNRPENRYSGGVHGGRGRVLMDAIQNPVIAQGPNTTVTNQNRAPVWVNRTVGNMIGALTMNVMTNDPQAVVDAVTTVLEAKIQEAYDDVVPDTGYEASAETGF